MLYEFLTTNREEILTRARVRVGTRTAPKPTLEELTIGIPLFFDELVATLRGGPGHREVMDRDAAVHGERRQRAGFTVAQVVRDYGDLCQVVTQLAIELRAAIDTEEFKTLNGCLDDAIAQAVTEFAHARERSIAEEETQRLGFLAHELRNGLQTASLSYEILKTGTVGIGGSTGAVLGRSLSNLRALVDRTVAQVRLDTGTDYRERVEISPFLEEVEMAGSMAAKERGVSLEVDRGEVDIAVEADRHLLGAAVSNLLQNALKFTHAGGHVHLRTVATSDRVAIEVEDQCGGLRPGEIEGLSARADQSARTKSGLGLGLMISKRAVEAMGGIVRAQSRDGIGCVFTIDLPRRRIRSDA